MSSTKLPQIFERKTPEGDELEREVCRHCDYISYQNPKIVTGVVTEYEGRVLLCKRAIEPQRGHWTIPAGYLEARESPQEGACREAWEEARAKVQIIDLLAVYTISHLSQVQLFYRANLLSPNVAAGPESLDVRYFDWDALPEDIAFPTVHWALQHYQDARTFRAGACVPFGNPPGESTNIDVNQ